MKSTQMRYLLALLNQPEEKRNQSDIARIFGVNKSTVSRALNEAVEQGLLAQKEQGYILTGYGREYVGAYERKLELVTGYLRRMGVDEEHAKKDAYGILDCCSEETVKRFVEQGRIGVMYEKFGYRPDKANVDGKDMEEYFNEGTYEFPYFFYRMKKKNDFPLHLSMANEGFKHPGTLVISGGGSYVELRIKTIVRYSKILGKEIEGHLQSLKYRMGSVMKQALINDGKVYIPLEALQIQYVENENILYGSLMCTIVSSVEKFVMPESVAMFIMYFV